jgi:hypothetical protein
LEILGFIIDTLADIIPGGKPTKKIVEKLMSELMRRINKKN